MITLQSEYNDHIRVLQNKEDQLYKTWIIAMMNQYTELKPAPEDINRIAKNILAVSSNQGREMNFYYTTYHVDGEIEHSTYLFTAEREDETTQEGQTIKMTSTLRCFRR